MEQDKWLSGRLTCKKLIDWCNEKFKEFEITNWVVTDIERTRFRAQDYEAWAAKLYVRFDLKDISKRNIYSNGTFLCFYSIREYKHALKDGYELYLKFQDRKFALTNLEIDIRKIPSPPTQ